ncbi:TetR/AcrR family transcriptional regulator [Rummeliibacillus sp. G93]|uniref:TetR/AcrR family transcriptional regulator n=1 Tax=Rummeliibacillus TaxID=648802 RepID=UPI00116E35D7|nr:MULTISPECIES: TetR/AcrR family transcriptional regulator [Rummeliibacillus]MCM3317243.1 TetR/AcrR family transcriptional regulator [Rummeliibacillus stabekisii]UQW96727.1 TetR/AcrR family transcriptional regulator [Rummeliibacillus sp. G93]GEL05302.1 TetR family transcriptional regulator [Rummeliibacillus stabekisii]
MDRKQEILEAASKSFSLFGYKATTMEQVAKLANVGKGTIYTFFANKEILLQEIVLKMILEMKAEVEVEIDPTLPFRDNAHRVLMKILQFREVHQLYAKLVEEEKELRTPAVKIMLERVESEIVSYIAEKFDIAIGKKELRECDSELVAYLLYKAYIAFVADWGQTHEKELTEDQIASLFQNTIFRGLLP